MDRRSNRATGIPFDGKFFPVECKPVIQLGSVRDERPRLYGSRRSANLIFVNFRSRLRWQDFSRNTFRRFLPRGRNGMGGWPWRSRAPISARLKTPAIGRLRRQPWRNCKLNPLTELGALVDSGARDLRASALLKLVRPFLDAMGQLMEKQTKVPPRVLSRSELILLGEQIEEALSLSTDLGIPDALGHLDLNPGNVIVSEGQCVFLDWAEAYVGNPLFSFQYLVEHFRRMAGADATAESALTSAYAEEWQSLVSPETLQEALALAPMLAVFAYAAATDAWSDQARLQDPKVAGYLRSLTRRMHREASRLKDRSALCPN